MMKIKSYRFLALRELSAQKITSFLILIAVVLSTIMTTAVGQSAGVLLAMRRQQAIAIGGDRYATFVQLTEAQASLVEQDARLSYTGRSIPLGSMELNNLLSLSLTEYWENGMDTLPTYTHLVKGRLPESSMELALPEDALQFLGFHGTIGDKITLPLTKALRHGIVMEAYDYTAEFTLVGITESNFLGYTNGQVLGFAGYGSAQKLLQPEYLYYNVDIRTKDKKSFQDTIHDLNDQLGLHELDTLYNYPYLEALGIRHAGEAAGSLLDDEGFSYLIMVGVLAAALILSAAGLVIYNILKIAVSQRIRQYGVLRAIGSSKGQLYAIVAAEVLLLCVVGIPAGLLLGLLSAKGILTAATNQMSPEMFLAQDTAQLQRLIAENNDGKWGYLLLSVTVTLLFAFCAAAPAAWCAAKVSPVAAMSGSTKKCRRRDRRIKKIRNFERYYASLNLRRNRGRTAVTILSLVMSITVFVTLQSFLSLLDVSQSVSEHLGDYSVVNEHTGISPTELAKLAENENVSSMAAQQHICYELDEDYYPVGVETDFALGIGECFQIFGLNDEWRDYAFAERLSPEQLAALRAGEGCVVRNPIPMEIEGITFGTTHLETGQTIMIAGKELPVLLTLDGYDGYFSVGNGGFINGVQVVVSDRLYPALTGMDAYAELRPILTNDADRSAFDAVLERFCSRIVGTTYLSYEDADRQMEESGAQIQMLAWGLILFIGLIGILNIINTVYTNIHTRVVEIGTQRAIGMSTKSLYKTFLWEGFYYGIIAAVIGCAAGYACILLIEAAAANTLALVFPPLLPMAEATALSILACLLATAVPLRKIAQVSIVEAVEAVE